MKPVVADCLHLDDSDGFELFCRLRIAPANGYDGSATKHLSLLLLLRPALRVEGRSGDGFLWCSEHIALK